MDLGNPVVIEVHYLHFGGMTCLGCRDEFLMVSALVCMLWTKPTEKHDVRLSIVMIH